MKQEKIYDGGGFPLFRSYHDYRLPEHCADPMHSDHVQFRQAFHDFLRVLNRSPTWKRRFTGRQVAAIEAAIARGGPRIHGFVWHHHQDNGVLQLVSEDDHRRIHHYGGRFLTGGRPH